MTTRKICDRCGATFESIAGHSAAVQLAMHKAWCCASPKKEEE